MKVGLKLDRLYVYKRSLESYPEVQVPVSVPLTGTYGVGSGLKGPVPVTGSLGAGAIF